MKRDEAVNAPDVSTHLLEDDGLIPNNPTLPLIVYRGAVDLAGAADPAAIFERIFSANRWSRSWRNGIYPFPHYHSTAHECLGIAKGSAEVRLGGEKGFTATVEAGDVVILPAGAGHQNLGQSRDLLVVGAYPPGPDWDLCRDTRDHDDAVTAIASVPLPPADPVYGEDGPLMTHWR